MQKFFENLDTLHRFTLNLDVHHDELQCEKCFSAGQFVSHGFLYKAQHQGQKHTVGKRIFCSNRCSRTGCGATCRLYLAEQVPHLHYTNTHLFVFILQLIEGRSIRNAYQRATQAQEPRHAYRWLAKLLGKLTDYRSWLQAAGGRRAHAHAHEILFHPHALPTTFVTNPAQTVGPARGFSLRTGTAAKATSLLLKRSEHASSFFSRDKGRKYTGRTPSYCIVQRPF